MARDESSNRDPENRRPGNGVSRGPARAPGAALGQRRGRSGYGMESIRPHLRAQLEQQKLMRPTFPPEVEEEDFKDKWSK